MAKKLKEIPIIITKASIKDGRCDYTYYKTEGTEIGVEQSAKNPHLFEDDLADAFNEMNKHLAVIDDAFKLSGTKFDDIDQLINDELTTNYRVSAFEIKGSDEEEAIILIGSKHVSSGFWMELKTKKIPLDNMSSYKWYNELKASSDKARREVNLYIGGKYVEDDEPEISSKQLKIGDAIEEFENGRV